MGREWYIFVHLHDTSSSVYTHEVKWLDCAGVNCYSSWLEKLKPVKLCAILVLVVYHHHVCITRKLATFFLTYSFYQSNVRIPVPYCTEQWTANLHLNMIWCYVLLWLSLRREMFCFFCSGCRIIERFMYLYCIL